MKIISIITGFVLLSLSSLTYSATKQVDIEFQVTHTPYVHFTGTAPGSTRVYDNDDIANWIYPVVVDIGTLGLESNVTGNCDISFSTLNNFDLLHTGSGNSLIKYKVLYRSQEFSQTSNTPVTTLCNSLPTALQFKATGYYLGGIWGGVFMQSGIYQDIITVTVVTQ